MSRSKGSKNEVAPIAQAALCLSLEGRVQLLATLIADTIVAQQQTASAIAKEFEND